MLQLSPRIRNDECFSFRSSDMLGSPETVVELVGWTLRGYLCGFLPKLLRRLTGRRPGKVTVKFPSPCARG